LIYKKGGNMTDRDFKKLEKMIKKTLLDILEGETLLEEVDTMTPIFSVQTLDDIESYLGHPILFMGIS
tara:strand:+ start:4135 stop:4338 length:204 start_codon:yes stop_codon:yes gene_type:complete